MRNLFRKTVFICLSVMILSTAGKGQICDTLPPWRAVKVSGMPGELTVSGCKSCHKVLSFGLFDNRNMVSEKNYAGVVSGPIPLPTGSVRVASDYIIFVVLDELALEFGKAFSQKGKTYKRISLVDPFPSGNGYLKYELVNVKILEAGEAGAPDIANRSTFLKFEKIKVTYRKNDRTREVTDNKLLRRIWTDEFGR